MAQNIIRTVLIRGRTEGMDQATGAVDSMRAAIGKLTEAEKRLVQTDDAVVKALQRRAQQNGTSTSFDRLSRSVDQEYAAQVKLANAYKLAEKELAKGNITHAQFSETLARAAGKYGLVVQANDNIAKSSQLASHQIQNLRFQMMDVAQSLGGGMSPLQVLMQQGGQIAGIFGPGQGGVLGILRAVGQAIPRGAAIGGGALAVGATFATAYTQSQREGIEENRGLRGVGLRSGLSRQELEKLYSGPQGLGVGDLSISESRSIGLGMAGAGLGSDAITRGLENARTMSVALNLSLDDTGKLLADFGRDPVKSYDALAKATGYANASTRQYVASLAEQGETDKALVTTLDAVSGRLGTYQQNTTATDRALTKFGNTASNMWSLFKRDVDAATDASGKHGQAVKSASEIAAEAIDRERKKVEERNAAYRERSDALVASMGIENRIAGMDPLRQSVVTAQRSVGAGPALSQAETEARKSESETQRIVRESLDKRIEEQTVLRNTIELRKALTEQTRASTISMAAEVEAIGKSAAEQARLSFIAQGRIAAGQGGKAISVETEKQILREAEAYGKLADSVQRARLEDQIKFERSQIGRSATDQGIASQLRPLGGMDDPQNAGAVRQLRDLAEMQRLRTETIQALDEMRSGTRGLTTGIFSDVRQGRDPRQGIVNSLGRMADQNFDRMISRPLTEGLMGKDGQMGSGLIGEVSSLTFDNDNAEPAEIAA